MRQSQLFAKAKKEVSKDEESINARLLIRAGFVDKLMAGVYTFLPLGFIVLKKIENIIREEMKKAGGVELLMPSLQPKDNWEKTGRWETMDDLYKIKDKSDREFALGPTHEEVIVPLVKKFVSSYKDLPLSLFQIQTKFRMELRSKSGLLRGREFIMKDLYSFHTNEENRDKYYDLMTETYKNVFDRIGIGENTYPTFAPGGTFSKYSDEFQTITSAGEDLIHICDKCHVAVNDEIIQEYDKCPKCGGAFSRKEKSVEIGNIFKLKNKFAEDFNLKFRDKDGGERFVIMGCYGIGLGRLLGAVVEVHHDEKGIIWPESIAPFKIHLINLKTDAAFADKIYDNLQSRGIEVLYDDRIGITAGEKFAESDLIGIPQRAVVSEKTGDKIEIKKRSEMEIKLVGIDELISININ